MVNTSVDVMLVSIDVSHEINNHCNGQASNNQARNANNPQMEQLLATQNPLMQVVL
jgi:hypothetical protein